METSLCKLSPHRDLQCYFEQPSASAALSDASADGFTVSGTWRQQFDWAVIEWNRNNVFEHPAFRYLPDGDLSGLTLVYEERRNGCLPPDSDLYPTVDWPFLRVWRDGENGEVFHRVPLLNYAEPIEGEYRVASATFDLGGQPAGSGFVAVSWIWEHHVHHISPDDTIDSILDALAVSVNASSTLLHAEHASGSLVLSYISQPAASGAYIARPNGNRIGVYTSASADSGLAWQQGWQYLSGGTLPTAWRYTLPMSSLKDEFGTVVPMHSVRKLRWTYAADFQVGEFRRSEFSVLVSNWSVTGGNLDYKVAGPGSRRIEDSCASIRYTGTWSSEPGNYSGGTIQSTVDPIAALQCTYSSPQMHSVYIGTRSTYETGAFDVFIDDQFATSVGPGIAGEDFLHRVHAGDLAAGTHTIALRRSTGDRRKLYFDFLELAIPEAKLPRCAEQPSTTLATDWDTDHSLALAPERTSWMIDSLGFKGRVNHYAGAMWFYELVASGQIYASAKLNFSGTPEVGTVAKLDIWRKDYGPESKSTFQHGIFEGDTRESIAKAFEIQINGGYTGIRAEADGSALTIFSRSMGLDGNQLTVQATTAAATFSITVPEDGFTNGVQGTWVTDTQASPRLNRAARDWCRAFYKACRANGTDVTAAFSTELRHGDPSLEAGIAQRYPSGAAVIVSTPALQTNFSPSSLQYWRDVYLCMAQVMAEAGVHPYLQFGEVQYWYFADDGSGLPFYDEYTKDRFRAEYGRELATIRDSSIAPADHPEEANFLPKLLGEFTTSVMDYVRQGLPETRFEVLYPVDVNDTPFNGAVNFPRGAWTPATLDNLKVESFTYTYARDLNLCRESIGYPQSLGFPAAQRSHLVGIADSVSPWAKEVSLAHASGMESVVLFALDQFCLIGYPPTRLDQLAHRSSSQS